MTRLVTEESVPELIKQFKDKKMNKITVEHDKKSIEEYYGHLKADFANKYIGGGSLTQGCVQ